MALIVGTDTYADLEDLQDLAASYGHSAYIDANDTLSQEGHARQATLYLDHAFAWIGIRSTAGQSLAWPRAGAVTIDGLPIAPDVVPSEVIVAQALLMAAAGSGDLAGGTGGSDREILSERADDAMVEYERGSADRRFPMISALVRHLTTSHLLGGFRQIMAARG